FHARARAYILGNRQIRTVVIAANWPMYFSCEGGFCATSSARLDLTDSPNDPARIADISAAMAREIDAYRAAGKTVVLVAPVPRMPWDVPRFMLSRIIQGKSDIGTGEKRADHDGRAATAAAFLAREAKLPGVFLVDPAASLCSTGPAGFCHAEAGGMPLYFDDNHVNGAGADPVAHAMLARLDRVADSQR
ncbi:MAG TPA: SGNH hydrolase domain-containing protein, partial [Rhizomicrobium sp.]|nr:SGNH hydrolase domain-containing protein [Rhizomicrobium sp.]